MSTCVYNSQSTVNSIANIDHTIGYTINNAISKINANDEMLSMDDIKHLHSTINNDIDFNISPQYVRNKRIATALANNNMPIALASVNDDDISKDIDGTIRININKVYDKKLSSLLTDSEINNIKDALTGNIHTILFKNFKDITFADLITYIIYHQGTDISIRDKGINNDFYSARISAQSDIVYVKQGDVKLMELHAKHNIHKDIMAIAYKHIMPIENTPITNKENKQLIILDKDNLDSVLLTIQQQRQLLKNGYINVNDNIYVLTDVIGDIDDILFNNKRKNKKIRTNRFNDMLLSLLDNLTHDEYEMMSILSAKLFNNENIDTLSKGQLLFLSHLYINILLKDPYINVHNFHFAINTFRNHGIYNINDIYDMIGMYVKEANLSFLKHDNKELYNKLTAKNYDINMLYNTGTDNTLDDVLFFDAKNNYYVKTNNDYFKNISIDSLPKSDNIFELDNQLFNEIDKVLNNKGYEHVYLQSVLVSLLERSGVNVVVVSNDRIKSIFNVLGKRYNGEKAFYYNKTVYLSEDIDNNTTLLHELLHPFVMVYYHLHQQEMDVLFNDIIKDEQYKQLYLQAVADYNDEKLAREEVVTTYITNNIGLLKLANKNDKNIILQVLQNIIDFIKELFDIPKTYDLLNNDRLQDIIDFLYKENISSLLTFIDDSQLRAEHYIKSDMINNSYHDEETIKILNNINDINNSILSSKTKIDKDNIDKIQHLYNTLNDYIENLNQLTKGRILTYVSPELQSRYKQYNEKFNVVKANLHDYDIVVKNLEAFLNREETKGPNKKISADDFNNTIIQSYLSMIKNTLLSIINYDSFVLQDIELGEKYYESIISNNKNYNPNVILEHINEDTKTPYVAFAIYAANTLDFLDKLKSQLQNIFNISDTGQKDINDKINELINNISSKLKTIKIKSDELIVNFTSELLYAKYKIENEELLKEYDAIVDNALRLADDKSFQEKYNREKALRQLERIAYVANLVKDIVFNSDVQRTFLTTGMNITTLLNFFEKYETFYEKIINNTITSEEKDLFKKELKTLLEAGIIPNREVMKALIVTGYSLGQINIYLSAIENNNILVHSLAKGILIEKSKSDATTVKDIKTFDDIVREHNLTGVNSNISDMLKIEKVKIARISENKNKETGTPELEEIEKEVYSFKFIHTNTINRYNMLMKKRDYYRNELSLYYQKYGNDIEEEIPYITNIKNKLKEIEEELTNYYYKFNELYEKINNSFDEHIKEVDTDYGYDGKLYQRVKEKLDYYYIYSEQLKSLEVLLHSNPNDTTLLNKYKSLNSQRLNLFRETPIDDSPEAKEFEKLATELFNEKFERIAILTSRIDFDYSSFKQDIINNIGINNVSVNNDMRSVYELIQTILPYVRLHYIRDDKGKVIHYEKVQKIFNTIYEGFRRARVYTVIDEGELFEKPPVYGYEKVISDDEIDEMEKTSKEIIKIIIKINNIKNNYYLNVNKYDELNNDNIFNDKQIEEELLQLENLLKKESKLFRDALKKLNEKRKYAEKKASHFSYAIKSEDKNNKENKKTKESYDPDSTEYLYYAFSESAKELLDIQNAIFKNMNNLNRKKRLRPEMILELIEILSTDKSNDTNRNITFLNHLNKNFINKIKDLYALLALATLYKKREQELEKIAEGEDIEEWPKEWDILIKDSDYQAETVHYVYIHNVLVRIKILGYDDNNNAIVNIATTQANYVNENDKKEYTFDNSFDIVYTKSMHSRLRRYVFENGIQENVNGKANVNKTNKLEHKQYSNPFISKSENANVSEYTEENIHNIINARLLSPAEYTVPDEDESMSIQKQYLYDMPIIKDVISTIFNGYALGNIYTKHITDPKYMTPNIVGVTIDGTGNYLPKIFNNNIFRYIAQRFIALHGNEYNITEWIDSNTPIEDVYIFLNKYNNNINDGFFFELLAEEDNDGNRLLDIRNYLDTNDYTKQFVNREFINDLYRYDKRKRMNASLNLMAWHVDFQDEKSIARNKRLYLQIPRYNKEAQNFSLRKVRSFKDIWHMLLWFLLDRVFNIQLKSEVYDEIGFNPNRGMFGYPLSRLPINGLQNIPYWLVSTDVTSFAKFIDAVNNHNALEHTMPMALSIAYLQGIGDIVNEQHAFELGKYNPHLQTTINKNIIELFKGHNATTKKALRSIMVQYYYGNKILNANNRWNVIFNQAYKTLAYWLRLSVFYIVPNFLGFSPYLSLAILLNSKFISQLANALQQIVVSMISMASYNKIAGNDFSLLKTIISTPKNIRDYVSYLNIVNKTSKIKPSSDDILLTMALGINSSSLSTLVQYRYQMSKFKISYYFSTGFLFKRIYESVTSFATSNMLLHAKMIKYNVNGKIKTASLADIYGIDKDGHLYNKIKIDGFIINYDEHGNVIFPEELANYISKLLALKRRFILANGDNIQKSAFSNTLVYKILTIFKDYMSIIIPNMAGYIQKSETGIYYRPFITLGEDIKSTIKKTALVNIIRFINYLRYIYVDIMMYIGKIINKFLKDRQILVLLNKYDKSFANELKMSIYVIIAQKLLMMLSPLAMALMMGIGYSGGDDDDDDDDIDEQLLKDFYDNHLKVVYKESFENLDDEQKKDILIIYLLNTILNSIRKTKDYQTFQEIKDELQNYLGNAKYIKVNDAIDMMPVKREVFDKFSNEYNLYKDIQSQLSQKIKDYFGDNDLYGKYDYRQLADDIFRKELIQLNTLLTGYLKDDINPQYKLLYGNEVPIDRTVTNVKKFLAYTSIAGSMQMNANINPAILLFISPQTFKAAMLNNIIEPINLMNVLAPFENVGEEYKTNDMDINKSYGQPKFYGKMMDFVYGKDLDFNRLLKYNYQPLPKLQVTYPYVKDEKK